MSQSLGSAQFFLSLTAIVGEHFTLLPDLFAFVSTSEEVCLWNVEQHVLHIRGVRFDCFTLINVNIP
jgi:hypothetical protein